MFGSMIRRLVIAASRYLILLAVICTSVAATTLLIYGTALTVQTVGNIISQGVVSTGESKNLVLAFIELVKLFLMSSLFYIIAGNLYELFIDRLPLPEWLVIHDLDTLEDKLVGVIVLTLAVLFLGDVSAWDGERDLLGYGVAMALVIGALTYFLTLKHNAKEAKKATAAKKGRHSYDGYERAGAAYAPDVRHSDGDGQAGFPSPYTPDLRPAADSYGRAGSPAYEAAGDPRVSHPRESRPAEGLVASIERRSQG